MHEIKDDPAIKLFGQKIPFQHQQGRHVAAAGEFNSGKEKQQLHVDPPADDEVTEKKKEADPPTNAAETNNNCNSNNNNNGGSESSPEAIQNPKTPPIDEETPKMEDANNKRSKDESKQQEKTLKKPDKLLPCPRCNSMETKFCYYNNYNVNQPRHFCKACQRYWTAGGTMRNVPVGAGRRKNKNGAAAAALHYRHITISDALQSPNGTHLPALKTNCRVLSFGNVALEEFHGLEDPRVSVNVVACKSGENGDESSSISSITVSNSMEESGKTAPQEPVVQTNCFLAPQVPCIPWPYPWNSAVPSPALCPPGYPISFYPAPFWNGCGVPGNWNIRWYPQHPSVPHTKAPNSRDPPTLGKHPREDDTAADSARQRKGCVLVPKTLRIDDPSEAAKSSIWSTLGIKNECVGKGGMFNAFQPKKGDETKKHVVEASPVLRANPAALSRSLNFHENC